MDDEILNAEEVAELLKCKPKTIYLYVRQKKLPYHKIGGLVRFFKSEIFEAVKKMEEA